MPTTDTIQVKRGVRRALPPNALPGELLLCEDTHELYAGLGEGGEVFLVSRGTTSIDCGTFGDTTVGYSYDGGTF